MPCQLARRLAEVRAREPSAARYPLGEMPELPVSWRCWVGRYSAGLGIDVVSGARRRSSGGFLAATLLRRAGWPGACRGTVTFARASGGRLAGWRAIGQLRESRPPT